MLQKMLKGGYKGKTNQWSFIYTNEDIKRLFQVPKVSKFVMIQQRNYATHIRKDNSRIVKRLFFHSNKSHLQGRKLMPRTMVMKNEECNENDLYQLAKGRKF